ncbi:MAG: IS110 family transposase [Methylococcaceae bacterium]|nr:IS110 family transposase [Methylococcaceae bacterium]
MKQSNTISIDLAKSVFQVAILNQNGKVLCNKKLQRAQLLPFITKQPASLIVMESCGGSNHWGRRFEALGHTPKLIAAQHVKPFVKTNKNDANDAVAIAEASKRPNMKFVSIKNLEQQDIQSIHRARQRLVDNRTSLVNHARGLLAEYGMVFCVGVNRFRKALAHLVNTSEYTGEMTPYLKELCCEWYEELLIVDKAIKQQDKKIKMIATSSDQAKRLMKIEGIGPVIATAFVATLGTQAKEFKNGREMAAYLGLTPKQHSSGGKARLMGISKRGDSHLRTLLMNGATSVINVVGKKNDPKSQWVNNLLCRMHQNKVKVALANKMVRIAWVILAKGETYKPERASAMV